METPKTPPTGTTLSKTVKVVKSGKEFVARLSINVSDSGTMMVTFAANPQSLTISDKEAALADVLTAIVERLS